MAKNKYSDIDLEKYSQGYKASSAVNTAEAQKQAAENAVKNFGDFKYSNQSAYENALNAYLNRGDFQYDLNGDALYQQYKNQYATLGKMAMMDTMGQASALTGGYGNSYANTAGYQAYQGYLQNLNDKIPELYQLALSKYNADGDRLLNNYSMLSQDRATEYGEWGDRYNQLVADRGYYADAYNDAYNRDYGMWSDNRTYDTNQYWNEYNTGYQADRDRIADEQWQKDFDEAVRQFNADLAERQRQYNTSLAAKNKDSDSGDVGNKGPATDHKNKDYDRFDQDSEAVNSVSDIKAELNEMIRNGASKSVINAQLRDYYKDGVINQETYTKLKEQFAPRGNTY